MKKMCLFLLIGLIRNVTISSAQLNINQREKIIMNELWFALRLAIHDRSLLGESKLKAASCYDMNQMKDENGNTPLHYVLLNPWGNDYYKRELAFVVFLSESRSKYPIDLTLQNNEGYTPLMLAAKHGYANIFIMLLNMHSYPLLITDFAIKNRKDGNKTVLEYAQGNKEITEIIAEYDAKYKKLALEEIIGSSNLIEDLSKIVTDYATPVNAEDMEADRAFEKEQRTKAFERECMEIDLGLPRDYLRKDHYFM